MVTGDTATVTLRAATDLRISVHAYGGRLGIQLLSWATAQLVEGESIAYELPLEGSSPSFTFSWEDSLGQAGAFSLRDGQIPYPLPTVEGEICDLSLVSLGWTPGVIEGVVESECEDRVKKTVALQTVAGHVSVSEMSLMDADVTAVTGIVSAVTTGSRTAVPLVPNGETSFRLEAGREKKIHPVVLVVETEASLSIPLPPLTRLTHHPERTGNYTRTVTLTRPGDHQDRQQEGDGGTRRRDDRGAHYFGDSVHIQPGDPEKRDRRHHPPGACESRGGGERSGRPEPHGDPGHVHKHRVRRILSNPCPT